MTGFTRLSSIAASMPGANIDTDVIMPKQFLKGIDREGLARGLFHDLRFDVQGALRADFILNRPEMAAAQILVVGPNFGCGSSREHAVWGMLQYGIRVIIGQSFAGIFADNAANNGLLLISLEAQAHARLAQTVDARQTPVTVDLEQMLIETDDLQMTFTIDPDIRRMLLLGLDRIDNTLSHASEIRSFQEAYLADRPWLAD
jgi:3-isopropylmalate/(R)-2-methylmalate dehydratase small subunit